MQMKDQIRSDKPYLLDQTPWLLFCAPTIIILRVALIKLRGIATGAEIKEPDSSADIDEDKNKLEENEVVLEDC